MQANTSSTGEKATSNTKKAPPVEAFLPGDRVTHPKHGVGRVQDIGEREISGFRMEFIEIGFEESSLKLLIPVSKAASNGLRRVASRDVMDKAFGVLRGKAKASRVMWSRRAQEYEAKINSGDPCVVAEVLRDLGRNADSGERSFSERQIFEKALQRMAGELAALEETDPDTAARRITTELTRGATAPKAAAANREAA